MAKKCIICSKEATLCIKDTSDYYCQECAEDNFEDLSYLAKIEEIKLSMIDSLIDDVKEEKVDEINEDNIDEPE